MNPSTDAARMEQLVTTMSNRIATITHALGTWVQDAPRDLQQIEQHVLRLVKDLGATLVASLCTLVAPVHPSLTVPCPCGQTARYQRQRPATVTTILGPITFQRPYYLCAACGHGQHPLDAQLQLCAGSRSAGLDELLALLGATQDSFAEAASVLERLTLVHVSPNSVRTATETLGATLLAQQQHGVAHARDGHDLPQPTTPSPNRLYITMDGVLAHLHERGWSEVKVGCCFQTRSRPERKRPEQLELRAHSLSYVTALVEAETFGWHLWQEAVRCGVLSAAEVVVLGDGAHWIWKVAELHFPQATQILDWYHASEYLWEAASAVWGETQPQREAWAHQQLGALWEGKVDQVLMELARHEACGKGVTAALTYYTTHRGRMDYAAYRARGLQLGSGSVESACKQLVSARLKQAGMIWDATGAEEVAVVRAWLKSERWQEAMALRAAPQRSYQRQRARPEAGEDTPLCRGERVGEAAPVSAVATVPPRREVSPEMLARVRAEMAQEKRTHPWRKAWSVKQQRQQQSGQASRANPALAA